MLGPTHALAGATSAGLLLVKGNTNYPFILLAAIAAIAALLPDLDGSESTIENVKLLGFKPLKFPGWLIDKLFAHRGFLHSLMAMVFLIFVLLGFFSWLPKEIVLAITLGYASHIVTDSLTPLGLPWLYPLEWRGRLLPKWLAIRTGSIGETLFFVLLLVLFAGLLTKAGYLRLG